MNLSLYTQPAARDASRPECYNQSVPDASVQPQACLHRELRLRWLLLLPAVFFTYSLAYLDRANYGFGAAAGMAETLNIGGGRAAFLGSLFFLGYFLFQVPGAIYARRSSATRLVFFALIGWGVLAALTGIVRSFWLLALDRLLLGVAESLIMPSMLILLSDWFTRAERSRANAILILGNPVTVMWMSAVTGYLVRAVGWQTMFILEGIPSILWAFAWIFLVRDHPRQASWLSAETSTHLERELDREQESLPELSSFSTALRTPAVLLLCVQFFVWSVGVCALVIWLPTILRAGSARGIETVGLLNAAPFALAVALMLAVAHFSDRSLNRKHFVWPFLVLSAVALLASYWAAPHNFWLSYACLIVAGGAMYAPYGPFFAIMPEMLPRNVAGTVNALINSCGALGGFVGTWLIGGLQSATGSSQAGIPVMAFSLLASGGIILALGQTQPTKPAL